MAFPDDVTLGVETFSLIEMKPTSSKRAIAGTSTGQSTVLTISHEVAKNGTKSSVMIFDDSDIVSPDTVPTVANNRLMLKLSLNPLLGRADADATIAEQRTRLRAILDDDASWTKFLNSEH